jgi:hypothetical protein
MYIVLDGGKKGKNIFSHFSFETGAGISRGFFFLLDGGLFLCYSSHTQKNKKNNGDEPARLNRRLS